MDPSDRESFIVRRKGHPAAMRRFLAHRDARGLIMLETFSMTDFSSPARRGRRSLASEVGATKIIGFL